MEKNLFEELKRIGIDENLAHSVSASLDPDYNASKKDVLTMQEAILQVQLRSDQRYHEFNSKSDKRYHELNNKVDRVAMELNGKIDKVSADLRVEIAAVSRQFWITFGGLICTITHCFPSELVLPPVGMPLRFIRW